jgi:hypothetical protein
MSRNNGGVTHPARISRLVDVAVEVGCVLLVALMAVNYATIDAGRLYAAAAAMVILVSMLAFGGSSARVEDGCRVVTALMFLLIYAAGRESELSIHLFGSRTVAVPIAGITLGAVGVLFGVKLMTAGAIGGRERALLLGAASTAAVMCLSAIGLYFLLRRRYTMDSRIVLGVVHVFLQGMLLFVVILLHARPRRTLKRFAWYAAVGILAVVILKALSVRIGNTGMPT